MVVSVFAAASLLEAGTKATVFSPEPIGGETEYGTSPGRGHAMDQPFRNAYIDPNIDSMGAYEELTSYYTWNLHIYNHSDGTVSPTISVGELSADFSPNVEFPVSLPSLGPGEGWIVHDVISSNFTFTYTLGYDSSRTIEPMEIPPGGGVQKITIKVKPVDERYTSNPFMRIDVRGDVIAGSNQQPEGATPTVEAGQGVAWTFKGWMLGAEYTFSAELQVENPSDVNLVHKPHIQIYVESSKFLDGETGTSITIYDEILEQYITYSVAPDIWQWDRSIADCWRVELGGLSQLMIPATINIEPDTLNLKSEGRWVTCYIELLGSLDANDIDVSTILLNNTIPADKTTGIGDYDDDNIADLMVKFDRSDVQKILKVGDKVNITVSGKTYDGNQFEGSDTIRVIDEGKK